MGEITTRLGLHKPTAGTEIFGDYFPDNYATDLQQIDDNVQLKVVADAGEIPVYGVDGLLVGSGITPAELEAGLISSILTDQGMLLYRGAATLAALSPATAGRSLLTQGVGADPIFGYPSHATLLNLSGDDHAQYLNTARHDLTARHGSAVVDHGSVGGLADDDHTQYIKHALATAASDFLVASGSGVFVKKTLAEVKTLLGVMESSFWNNMPGSPVYQNTTQFTITDLGNVNKYDLMLKKGVLLTWLTSGGTWQIGMVVSSSYGSDTVAVNIIGNALAGGFTAMKYCMLMTPYIEFYLPGTSPSSLLSGFGCFIPPYDIYPIGADLVLEAAATGTPTGSTVVNINDDAVSLFTVKPTIIGTNSTDLDNVATSPATAVAALSKVTADWEQSTSPAPSDGHVYFWYMPASWRYRS